MFGSAIINSAIGVIFGFLAISLFTSAIVEAINSALKLRARNLQSAIIQLVNDPNFEGLALNLYQHALISPFGPGELENKAITAANGAASNSPGQPAPQADKASLVAAQKAQYQNWGFLPSYIDKTQFARAFLDVTGLTDPLAAVTKLSAAKGAVDAAAAAAAGQDPVKAAADSLNARLDKISNPQIKQFLQGVVTRTGSDLSAVEQEVADWFDASMDRLSGKFKRNTQVWTFAIALLSAALLNLDALHVADQIWAHPQIVQNLDVSKFTDANPADQQKAITEVSSVLKQGFPAGWADGHFFQLPDPGSDATKPNWILLTPAAWLFWTSLGGWLITAVSALFGAPFWFDTLQSLVRLKGAGPSPEEKDKGTAAAF